MSKLLQVRLDDKLKAAADSVFSSMGLDISTAIRMFLTAAVETRSLPFEVKARTNTVAGPSFKSESTSGKMSREAVFGCMRGQFKMADDFDAPLQDFKEYME
jgi:DNA-damage-inducible protein J